MLKVSTLFFVTLGTFAIGCGSAGTSTEEGNASSLTEQTSAAQGSRFPSMQKAQREARLMERLRLDENQKGALRDLYALRSQVAELESVQGEAHGTAQSLQKLRDDLRGKEHAALLAMSPQDRATMRRHRVHVLELAALVASQ